MIIRAVLVFTVLAAAASGASTTAWEMNTYQDFLRGRFSGLSLTREGQITLAPRAETFFASQQPAVWALAQGPDGSLYAGTGHRGRVYRIDTSGKGTLLWTAPQPEIFAIAVGPDGAVYAGSSPDGKVYRIEKGQAKEYFAPAAKYIWSLAFGRDGALYVGTGDQGRVYRVTGQGLGEPYYETGQSHVTCLAVDKDGSLLAGSEPNGLLYRISAKDKAFVLYDANLPEIRTIVPQADGSIYAAALGGLVAQRTQQGLGAANAGAAAGAVTAAPTVITITDEAQAGLGVKPSAEAPKPAVTAQPPVYSPAIDLTGGEKSAVFRIHPDNTVETMWSSTEENVYDLLHTPAGLIFSTDAQGRIYRMSADRKLTLVAQTNEGEAARIAAVGGSVFAASGSGGKLFRLGPSATSSGEYESPVHDAGSVARWGQLSWRGQTQTGRLVFRTRAGNSARPDRTWSEWSKPLTDPRASRVESPNARFIQWKAEFSTGPGGNPSLTGVTVSYLPQNTAPVVKQITVNTQMGATNLLKAPPPATAQAATYSITVTDTGESTSSSAGTPTQAVSRGVNQQILINWQAEDSDGDRLTYALFFRGEEEQTWKLLKADLADTSLSLEGDVFADGKYFFRVTASDRPANPGSTAREADLVSSPILFDATPPAVSASVPRKTGVGVEIEVEATDSASALRRGEFSVNASSWQPMEPADGVIDGLRERFLVRLSNVGPGEHLVVVRVHDSAGNAGLAKVVVR